MADLIQIKADIKKHEKLYAIQLAGDDPLRFLTATNLHRGQSFVARIEGRIGDSLSELKLALIAADTRVIEVAMLKYDQNVKGVAKSDILASARKNLTTFVNNIVWIYLDNNSHKLKSPDVLVNELRNKYFKSIKSIKSSELDEIIGLGILSAVEKNVFKLDDDTLAWYLNSDNFPHIDAERVAHFQIAIYIRLARGLREDARTNIDISRKIYHYRKQLANLFLLTGDNYMAQEELCQADLYDIQSTNDISSSTKSYARLQENCLQLENLSINPNKTVIDIRHLEIFALTHIFNQVPSFDMLLKARIARELVSKHNEVGRHGSALSMLAYARFYELINSIKDASSYKILTSFRRPKIDLILDNPEGLRIVKLNNLLIACIQSEELFLTESEDENYKLLFYTQQLLFKQIIKVDTFLGILKNIAMAMVGGTVLPLSLPESDGELQILKKDLRYGETNSIELKQSFADTTKIARAICAFANTNGGQVYIGIAELKDVNKKDVVEILNDFTAVIGINRDTEQARKDLASHLEMFGINTASLDIDEYKVLGKTVCRVTVPAVYKQSNEITFYQNEAYSRVDKENLKVSGRKLKEMLLT